MLLWVSRVKLLMRDITSIGHCRLFFAGGKVVARHEDKAHRFLFPSDQEDKLREVVMTKGRRYEASLF